MRLLRTGTFLFEEFENGKTPPYAILSHCWGEGEISYQDMCDMIARERDESSMATSLINLKEHQRAFDKICRFRCKAKENGHDYVWIDTCCIDKRSSAELQESINSMFQWYHDAAVCYAYLHDILFPKRRRHCTKRKQPSRTASFGADSRWFSRGWTLQEAIAPQSLVFYDTTWTEGESQIQQFLQLHVCENFQKVSRAISRHEEQKFGKFGVARRMSWAAGRQTTRPEDRSYSLIGLFDVNMTTIYGEGARAFQRLQQEILSVTDDASILAWQNTKEDTYFAPNGLARSPDNFAGHRDTNLSSLNFDPQMTPRGLRATLELVKDPWEPALSYAVLITASSNQDRNLQSLVVPLLLFETDAKLSHAKDCVRFSDPTRVPSSFVRRAKAASVCFLRQPQVLPLCQQRLGISLSSTVWESYRTTFTYPMQVQRYRRHFPAIFGTFSPTEKEVNGQHTLIVEVESRASPKDIFAIIIRYQVSHGRPVWGPCSAVIRRKKRLHLFSAIQLVKQSHRHQCKRHVLAGKMGWIHNDNIAQFNFFQSYWLQDGYDSVATPPIKAPRSPVVRSLNTTRCKPLPSDLKTCRMSS